MTEAITVFGLLLEIAVLGSIFYPLHGTYLEKVAFAGLIGFFVAISAARLARNRDSALWLTIGIAALSPILFLTAIYFLYSR